MLPILLIHYRYKCQFRWRFFDYMIWPYFFSRKLIPSQLIYMSHVFNYSSQRILSLRLERFLDPYLDTRSSTDFPSKEKLTTTDVELIWRTINNTWWHFNKSSDTRTSSEGKYYSGKSSSINASSFQQFFSLPSHDSLFFIVICPSITVLHYSQ